MFSNFRKTVGYLLTGLVFILTIFALLGIWEVISFEHIMRKILTSMFVIFLASVIILFIFGVILKEEDKTSF